MNAATSPAALAALADALAASAPGETVYGVLQLGTAQVALSLDALREVLPCPAQFSGLPASTPGLLGAMAVRGKVVPVLDLRVPLGLPAPREPGQVIVMLRHGGRLLGLLADGVRGLTKLAPGALHAMGCDGAGLLFCGSFERGEDASVVSVLDPAALMRLPGLPLLRDDAPGEGAGRAGAATPRRALMLVRCGAAGLALDVTTIHATLPRVTLHASSLDGRTCRGVIDHAGQRLPAVDPLALMGLGALPAGEPCEALLLRFDTGLVALLVSQVIDIVRVPETDLLPLAPLAVRRPSMFRAALKVPGHGEQLVLCSDALRREPELLSFATLNTRQPGAAAEAGDPATVAAGRRGHAVITYDIGAEVATRLIQVSEVLPLPTDCIRAASAHPAVTGMFTYRGQAITLVCLSTLLGTGATPDAAHARVMIVSQDCGHFGFIVPRLCHIENTVWEQPKGARDAAANGPQALGPHAVVELGQGTQRRTLHLIDLRALARSLIKGGDAAPADEQPADVALAA